MVAISPMPPEETISYEVSQISAPVFGPDGRPALAIGVHGLPHQIDPARIGDYSAEVLEAAARVTERLHGRRPDRG